MPIKEARMMALLADARDTAIAPRKGFEEAFNAVPGYQRYMREEILARSSYAIDDQIMHFLKNRMRDLRSITVMTANGVTMVFEYVYSTGKYLVCYCSKALDTIISDKE